MENSGDNSLLERRSGESEFEHHRRLIEGKLSDKTLSDYDYTELAKYVYGKEYSTDVARRMFYGSKRTLDIMDSERISSIKDKEILSDLDKKMFELQKEQQKFRDQRAAFNKTIRDRSRQEELNDILVDAVKHGDLPTLNYEPTHVEESTNDLLVSLNDIHYGIDIENAWNIYNPERCREMVCVYLDKILAIAETHHSENCIVYNCGDSISGNIHLTLQIANRENVVEQVKGVSELIAEFLAELSKRFNLVEYVSVPGNHSRLSTKDDSPSEERLDDLIEWYLAARLQHFKNVYIRNKQGRLDNSIFLLDLRGKTYVVVHGDFDESPTKIAALQAMTQVPIYAVLSGHKHHNACNDVQGIKTVMAGSFVGVDDYCIEKRIYGRPQQMVCVCDNTGIVCHYDVIF